MVRHWGPELGQILLCLRMWLGLLAGGVGALAGALGEETDAYVRSRASAFWERFVCVVVSKFRVPSLCCGRLGRIESTLFMDEDAPCIATLTDCFWMFVSRLETW